LREWGRGKVGGSEWGRMGGGVVEGETAIEDRQYKDEKINCKYCGGGGGWE